MTRDEILAKGPGREMDALVAAEKGISPFTTHDFFGNPHLSYFDDASDGERSLYNVPHFSTKLSAATPLLDEMLSALDAQDRTWVLHRDRDNWAVSELYHDDLIPIAAGKEAPEAIAKAYLIWRGSEND